MEFGGDNHASLLRLQNGDQIAGELAGAEIEVKTVSGQSVVPFAKVRRIRVVRAEGFENSLGLKFVPIPGTDTLFGIWDTRVRDYRAYADANPKADAKWKNPGIEQGENDPVVMVSWDDAHAFCAWLTQKERSEGRIAPDEEYRLPTDKEWSLAAGPGKYTWGNDWPPPDGIGDFNRTASIDDFKHTLPVGSFKPNQYGVYDLVGGVWQLCEDFYKKEMNDPQMLRDVPELNTGNPAWRTKRGAARNFYSRYYQSSSVREPAAPEGRSFTIGFRCVLGVTTK